MSRPPKGDAQRRFDERLGAFLRRTREYRGWTVVEASSRLGVSDDTLRGWEKGERSMSVFDLARWAAAFGAALAPFHAARVIFEEWLGQESNAFARWLDLQPPDHPKDIPLTIEEDHPDDEPV